MPSSKLKPTDIDLRLEYEKTQEMAIHYDILNWMIGSILIAGVFIAIGTIGTKFEAYLVLSIVSFIILFIWRLYYKRHKAIQRVKFIRLQEIETLLYLRQHIAVNEADKQGKANGIKGDQLADLE